MRTVGREEGQAGWRVATSEVGVCCGARGGSGNSRVLLGLLRTGTHAGFGSSEDDRDLLFGRGGGYRISSQKLLLCLFIIQGRVLATHTSET